MGSFRAYGENAFTFLFFQAAHRHRLIRHVLLPSLQPFQAGTELSVPADAEEDGDLWLFPNFGRKYGFGEPDALLLIDDRSFWFEVETRVQLRGGHSALQHALLQLARFHYFHDALQHGSTVRVAPIRHRVLTGLTIGDRRTVKQAMLNVKGHPVLQKIRSRLARSTPHYVLLTQRKPRGLGGRHDFAGALADALRCSNASIATAFTHWAALAGIPAAEVPVPLPVASCWYTYWSGHLDAAFRAVSVPDPLTAGGYVAIRR